MWISLLATGLIILIISRVLKYHSDLKSVACLPGLRSAFGPLSLLGAVLPTSFLNPGLDWQWLWRADIYTYYQSQTISSIPFIFGSPSIYTASIHVAKQILNGGPTFFKAPDSTALLLLWGDNVISSNSHIYKRHRRIVGPAFNGSNYALVAQESVRLYHEFMEGEDCFKSSETTAVINPYISKFALGIITRCGFGIPFSWSSDASVDEMSFGAALALVSEGGITRLATPSWAYMLPIKKLQKIDAAYKKLSSFMREFITCRKVELGSHTEPSDRSRQDLFTRLVEASEADGKNKLDDQELIGNIFVFMFAGHETTAHTTSATLALLALHQDEQEKVVAHIDAILGKDRDPTLDDFDALYEVRACFQEAGRMFPAASIVTRDTTETVSLTLPAEDGGRSIVIPPGVRLVVDMIGVHYNPRVFPEPERFAPSRWYGVHESDLTFFGLGPRACLGRKFALVEAVCFLALFLRDWKVEPALKDGETEVQWRRRVMQGGLVGLAFGVRGVPLKLTRRVSI